MKRKKQTFNHLLRRYNKYLRKIENLRLANRNERRQNILAKHIERLHEQLMRLKLNIQKGTVVTAAVVGALAFAPQVADAQNFGAPQTNPFGLTQVGAGSYSKPIFVDLDGDGDLDVISGLINGGFSYYENTGTNTSPAFAPLQTNPFGLMNIPSVNGYSTPTFVDIDGDGDLDMISGEFYTYNNYEANFHYYENIGTVNAPAFAALVTNPFGLTGLGNYSFNTAPTFADLDNDGDFDMLSGDRYGNFYYYENTGTNIAPAFAAPVTNPFSLAGTGYYQSTPTLVDVDGDGDFDLMSGSSHSPSGPAADGSFIYYENTGTNVSPVFAASQNNSFGLTALNNNSAPTIADLNNDGKLDVLSGINNGDLIYFPGCSPSSATISPTAVCSYTSPSGNIWTTSNTYMDTIPNASGCDSVITINLTVNSLIDQPINPATFVACDGGSANVSLASSQTGVDYYLRDNTNDTIVDGPTVGTGSGIALNTGNISSTMTYNVYSEKLSPTDGLDFDGMDDYVNAGGGINLANASFSIEFWTKRNTTLTGDNHIIGQGSSATTNNSLHVGFRGNGNFTFAFFANDLDAAGLSDINWHHWAVTFDVTTNVRVIYRDGISVANDMSASNYTGTGNFLIGKADFGSNNYNGKVDEVRVWSVAKTQTEIQADMNTCLAGTEAGLVAYYQFEDGAGSTTLTDLTANANNGTLQNMDPANDWASGTTVCSTCNMQMTQTVTVTVGQATTSTISPTACGSYTSPSGDSTWTMSGTYMDTIPNASGCDSVMTINLTVNTVDTSTSTNGFVITSNETGSGATYRWLDCNNSNAVIPSETAQTYTATANGDYAVEVTINGCTDTSACVNMVVTGVNQFNSANISVYPNPINNQFTIDLGKLMENTQINVISIDGKIVYNNNLINSSKINIDASNWSKGVYFVQFKNEEMLKTIKLIKQ